MTEKYRIIKRTFCIGVDDDPNYPDLCEIVHLYDVQVKTFLFWHSVKTFEKIAPAVRLLHYLRREENER